MKQLLYIACLCLSLSGSAQEFSAKIIGSSHIEIGEQISVEILFRSPVEAGLPEFPELKNGQAISQEIELVSISQPDIKQDAAITEIKQVAYITFWDSGSFVVPGFSAFYDGDSIYTNSLSVQVAGIDVNTDDKPKDIYKIYDADWSLWDQFNYWFNHYWYWLLIVGLIILLALKLPDWLRSSAGKTIKSERLPTIPFVNQRLEEIKTAEVWKKGEHKRYYSELTETIWLYLEEHLNVSTLDQTSDQIMDNLSSVKLEPSLKQKLRELLKTADMVKFAKSKPDPKTNETMWYYAKDFVEGSQNHELEKK